MRFPSLNKRCPCVRCDIERQANQRLPHARAARARPGLRSSLRPGACEHAFGGGKRARRARGWGHPFTRTYDSRDKDKGDFGIGWKLGISDVRVEKSGKTGAYWKQDFIDSLIFKQYCLRPAQAATVTVTFPGGRQYRFQPKSSPECQYLEPLTTPDIVWESTSDPDNPTIKLVAAGGTSTFARDVGNGVVQLQDSNFDIWDPRQFTLTVEDGTVYQIDQDKGVTQVTDRVGNTLAITPDGILHSSGKQVTFLRDDKGRITTITDPAGASMTYAYDGNGDLSSYTDRLSNTTQFAYASNHYLDQIQDPLGRLPIRNDYDTDGRLLSSTDAAGNKVVYTHNLAANQEQVADRLGHVTLYTYNDRGDVTQKTDATGAVWSYTFDIHGNKLSETDPLGHTKLTTFDGANNPLTETDALGHVTTNTYNFLAELVTTTDPLGHVTSNNYGAFGDRMSATDAVGNTTKYTYDVSGFFPGLPLTETDPLGNVTTYAYDSANNLVQRTDPLGQRPRRRAPRGRREMAIRVRPGLSAAVQLRWARQDAKLSQKQLAERAGVSQQQIAKLEDPDENPTLATLEKVFDALGAQVDVEAAPKRKAVA